MAKAATMVKALITAKAATIAKVITNRHITVSPIINRHITVNLITRAATALPVPHTRLHTPSSTSRTVVA